jgi:hypothetical protein
VDDLERFYGLVKEGTKVDEFLRHHTALYPYIKSNGLIPEYRLGKGRMKRLRDEIGPVAIFVSSHATSTDRIQLPLDSSAPDCNVWHGDPAVHRTIEITLAQALERLNLMNELNDTGWGRGFLGLTDDRPKGEFDKRMAQTRDAYSTDQVRETMIHALTLCAKNKAHSRAHTLIIGASMNMLPRQRWMEMQSGLAEPVAKLGFREIYLVGFPDDEELCLRLK